MLQPIVSFDQDDEGHWRAVLACGHRQHVRHQPPLVARPWVLTDEGRRSRVGQVLDCRRCDVAADDGRRLRASGYHPIMANLTIDELIFVGLRGYALAVHRDTGHVVWANSDLKSGYTTLLLDGDRLIVSTNGYLFCLDPLTGRALWENPLKGYGVGVASLASTRGAALPLEAQAADAEQRSSSAGGSSST